MIAEVPAREQAFIRNAEGTFSPGDTDGRPFLDVLLDPNEDDPVVNAVLENLRALRDQARGTPPGQRMESTE